MKLEKCAICDEDTYATDEDDMPICTVCYEESTK